MARKNRSGLMLRRTQPVWRDQNHEFRVRQVLGSTAKRIADSRKLRKSRQPSNRAGLLAVRQSAKQSWLIVFHAHRLRQRAVRNNRDAIHISARQRANFKSQL